MTDYSAPITKAQIRALVDACAEAGLDSPHFVKLRRDKKIPCEKGWLQKPLSKAEAMRALKDFDIGIKPASIGMAVVDNDHGGTGFFEVLRARYQNAVVEVTPSSSGKPGRGHAWINCEDAENVGNHAVYHEDEKVGEFRANNGQVRLTREAVDQLTFAIEMLDQNCRESVMAHELYELTKHARKPNGAIGESKRNNCASVVGDMGVDRKSKLPDGLHDQMIDEFAATMDRSAEIARWTWRLRPRGYRPIEIVRFLKEVPEVQARIAEKGDYLARDVLGLCQSIDHHRRTILLSEFEDVMGGDLAEWVWVTQQNRFVRRSDGLQFDEKQFGNHFRSVMPKGGLIPLIFARKTPVQICEKAVYLPSMPEFVGDDYNTWRSAGVKPKKGDTSLIERHFELLLPNKKEREMLLDVLYYLVCQPQVKLKFAVVVQGGQGIGKSLIGRLLERVVGRSNIRFPSNDEIAGRWTVWQQGVGLAIVEELRIGRYDIADKLKPVITEPTLRIENKNVPLYTVENKLNLLAFTNHKDAVKLEPDDRRWLVFGSPMVRQPVAYYEKLFEWIDSSEAPGAFLYYLQQRKPGLKPNQPAPMTKAKSAMFGASRPRWETQLARWSEDREGPFAGDLFTFNEVTEALSRIGYRPGSIRLTEHMEKMGAIKHGRAKDSSIGPVTLWSIRRHDHYAQMSHRDRTSAYHDQIGF